MMVLHHMGPGHRDDHGHQILDQSHQPCQQSNLFQLQRSRMMNGRWDLQHHRSMMVRHIGHPGHRSDLSHFQQWQRSNHRTHQSILRLQRNRGGQPPTSSQNQEQGFTYHHLDSILWRGLHRPTSHGSHNKYIMNR